MAYRQPSEDRVCTYCSGKFRARGLASHERHCPQRPAAPPVPVPHALTNIIQRDREAGNTYNCCSSANVLIAYSSSCIDGCSLERDNRRSQYCSPTTCRWHTGTTRSRRWYRRYVIIITAYYISTTQNIWNPS